VLALLVPVLLLVLPDELLPELPFEELSAEELPELLFDLLCFPP
jgi:hypothetical protein